jgi:hypothetical protein
MKNVLTPGLTGSNSSKLEVSESPDSSGRYGGGNLRILSQSMPAKNGWFLISSIPDFPMRFSALQINFFKRSFASLDTSTSSGM